MFDTVRRPTGASCALALLSLLLGASAAWALPGQPPPTPPTGIMGPIAHERVARITNVGGGWYIKAGSGDARSTIDPVANTKLLITENPDGTVHIQTRAGTFLTAVNGGGSNVRADAASIGPDETFHKVPESADATGLGTFRLYTVDMAPVMICPDGRVRADGCAGAMLELRYETLADGIIRDPDLSGADVTDNGDGSVDVYGPITLRTPMGEVTLTAAEVILTYDEWGAIDTIVGTVGTPTLSGNANGAWSVLGDFQTSADRWTIGYARPDDPGFDDARRPGREKADLPLNDDTKYIFLSRYIGLAAQWGSLHFAGPHEGAFFTALDHTTGTFLVYTELPSGEGPTPLVSVDAVGFGVSAANGLTYSPRYRYGVDDLLTGFDGNLFIGGALSFNPVPNAGLDLDGTLVLDAHPDALLGDEWGDAVEAIGFDGVLSVDVSVGVMSTGYYLGGASMQWVADDGYFTFSGEYAPDDNMHGLPFYTETGTRIWGMIDGTNDSFVGMEGEFVFDQLFTQQTFEGYAEFSGHGGTIAAEARFAGMKVDVSGSFDGQNADFSGSFSHKYNAWIGKVKTTITARFDTSGPGEVELSATAKFCSGGSCDSIGIDSISVQGNGKIRICVDVPGYGQACDTMG